jgi:hypothetical protein
MDVAGFRWHPCPMLGDLTGYGLDGHTSSGCGFISSVFLGMSRFDQIQEFLFLVDVELRVDPFAMGPDGVF